MVRQKIIAGNWKMNGNKELVDAFNRKKFTNTSATVIILPPAPYIQLFTNNTIEIGIQNFHPNANGALTGEVGIQNLQDLRPTLKWALIGHSERRTLFNETDTFLQEKLNSLLTSTSEISAIICCGEEEGQDRKQVLKRQIMSYFSYQEPDPLRIVIAYEPVWAIGTGKVATPSIVQEAHQYIRSLIKDSFGSEIADEMRIIYGGSVNVSNSSIILAIDGVDGFLIGGASLNIDDFSTIIDSIHML